MPNAECAQWTNDDRSEPYVGAMVVREHYRKFKDVRLLELLYDDLRTWPVPPSMLSRPGLC